jgi:hypothetical protein
MFKIFLHDETFHPTGADFKSLTTAIPFAKKFWNAHPWVIREEVHGEIVARRDPQIAAKEAARFAATEEVVRLQNQLAEAIAQRDQLRVHAATVCGQRDAAQASLAAVHAYDDALDFAHSARDAGAAAGSHSASRGRTLLHFNGRVFHERQLIAGLRCAQALYTAFSIADPDLGAGDRGISWQDVEGAHGSSKEVLSPEHQFEIDANSAIANKVEDVVESMADYHREAHARALKAAAACRHDGAAHARMMAHAKAERFYYAQKKPLEEEQRRAALARIARKKAPRATTKKVPAC